MSDFGSAQVATPAPSPGYPTNPSVIVFDGFTGLNTKASQQGIADQEMFICDGLMPLGKNNLRTLPDLGTAIYTATGGRTILRFGFGNIGALPICLIWLSDGSLVQLNLISMGLTTIAPAGTITGTALDFSQWSSLYSIIVANQTNGYWLWDGTHLFTATTVAPFVDITNGGSGYTSAPLVTATNAGGATFSATVTAGQVTLISVTNPGTGLSFDTNVILSFSGGGSDTTCRAHTSVTAASQGISSVTVTNGGYGYSSLINIAASTAGQTIQPQFTVIGSNGVITQVIVTNPGLGFSSVPTLTVTDVATGGVGTGAVLTAILSTGQITAVTIDNAGTGYVSPPTITILGDGVGGEIQATIAGGVVDSLTIVNPGTGYSKADLKFSGGNAAAEASVNVMPFGVSGTTVETYQSRVWVANGRVIQFSGPGDPSDFSSSSGAGAFPSTDSFLKVAFHRLIQSNGFLYMFADSSINYISGVTTSGVPATTTFSNLNVDPQIGTPWLGTVQPFGRDIVFANPIGVYVSYGGAVTKVSDALDGIYSSVPSSSWPAGFEPTAAVMTIFGIQTYVLLMRVLDQVSGSAVTKALMWDGKKWWTSPQTGLTVGICATQEINSVLTAYCSPDATTIKPMFHTASTGLTKYLYSKLWDAPGVFVTKQTREYFALINVNSSSAGAQATGYFHFTNFPANNSTITINGVVWTFVTGTPVGNQIKIQSTLDLTLTSLASNVSGSTNASMIVATYAAQLAPTSRLAVTYGTPGTAGNAFTLAAGGTSNATVSAATLTGGVDGDLFYLAPITENGVGDENLFNLGAIGPTILGPVASSQPGRIIGVRVRTTAADIQINSITPFNQITQSNV